MHLYQNIKFNSGIMKIYPCFKLITYLCVMKAKTRIKQCGQTMWSPRLCPRWVCVSCKDFDNNYIKKLKMRQLSKTDYFLFPVHLRTFLLKKLAKNQEIGQILLIVEPVSRLFCNLSQNPSTNTFLFCKGE